MKVEVKANISIVVWIIFIILKLTKIITWSWWIVNIPLFVIIFVSICAYLYMHIKKPNVYYSMLGLTETVTIYI